MKIYKKRNHDIVVDERWACKNCHAKGPELNKRNCINPRHNHAEENDDGTGHRHKRRKPEADTDHEENNDRSNGADMGIVANKQARKRAQEKHAEINANKRRKHLEAHQKNNEFELRNDDINNH
eukprot:10932152-Heterocapsa_arctica.AAC.1